MRNKKLTATLARILKILCESEDPLWMWPYQIHLESSGKVRLGTVYSYCKELEKRGYVIRRDCLIADANSGAGVHKPGSYRAEYLVTALGRQELMKYLSSHPVATLSAFLDEGGPSEDPAH